MTAAANEASPTIAVEAPGSSPRLTTRGLRTRARIVQSAAELFYLRGVNATTLDDVRLASSTSKSQLYKYFPDKRALIHAVIEVQSAFVLDREEQRLRGVRSLAGLRRWRDALVQANSLQNGSHGCALGCMSIELSDTDELSRAALFSTFAAWEALIAGALTRLRDLGVLSETADPGKLATGVFAAVQGGYLLAQNAHDSTPMAVALDMALAYVESFTVTT
ncbi:TetR/AcrR family transcriptional regulator [Pseudofrankia inefficax]|uniref:Regulatory protein TetR n=1 Tax=Pseudofrankia inefficax (strain DSM 45817 / CECT 9037 / DDB 130130 / EuI1c) TaxID=298654 RepID=E3J807_PSEI1|nr:TetR/AcrR family transcriptional regulator [Pseudofrankia inefficax]ADP82055.1 regulatory protein TetR [Pseudofrankia inefficax]